MNFFGLFVLGCVDQLVAYAIPREVLEPVLPKLNTTQRDGGKTYWHIKLAEDSQGKRSLLIPNEPHNLPLGDYELQLTHKDAG